jgi:hypothetical protein
VLLIRNPGDAWKRASEVEFAKEAELQRLLYESPELLSGAGDHPPAIFIAEAGLPGSGYTDLIGIDTDGDILIIETKLAKNPEIRRKVIGQVLEYAAYLWGMSYDELDDLAVEREGKTIADLLEAKAPELSRDALRDRVGRNLADGRFRLLIAVDKINAELEKIIAYVSSRGTGVRLEAVELELYRHGEIQILVPHLYGQLEQPAVGLPPASPVSLQDLQARCPNEHARRLFDLLLDAWQHAGNPIKIGRTTVSMQANVRGKPHTIVWVYPDHVENNFSDLERSGAPEVGTYRAAIAALPGFNREEILTKPQPNTAFAGLTEDTVQRFLQESLKVVERWMTE